MQAVARAVAAPIRIVQHEKRRTEPVARLDVQNGLEIPFRRFGRKQNAPQSPQGQADVARFPLREDAADVIRRRQKMEQFPVVDLIDVVRQEQGERTAIGPSGAGGNTGHAFGRAEGGGDGSTPNLRHSSSVRPSSASQGVLPVRTTFAGMPATVASGGTLRATKAPAPTVA